MPSAIMTIRKETTLNGTECFICSVWEKVKDIGVKVPLDSWELWKIVPDKETLKCLNDVAEEEKTA